MHTSLTMNSTEEEEVWCECSDDETYNPCKLNKGTWEPTAEDMLKVFEELKTKKVLELNWKCPGRRPPESDQPKEPEVREEVVENPQKQEEKKPVSPSEFDFDDFSEAKPKLTPRRTPGSAPKSQRMARMDKVLKEVMHQRKLQQAEREAKRLAKSPRAPGSPSRARLGSPAGSPRTPPAATTPTSNRQSPINSTPVPDGIPATPVRAPMQADTIIRTSIYDSLSAAGGAPTPNSTTEASVLSTVISTPPVKLQTGQVTPNSLPNQNMTKEITTPVVSSVLKTEMMTAPLNVETPSVLTSVAETSVVQVKTEPLQEGMDTT